MFGLILIAFVLGVIGFAAYEIWHPNTIKLCTENHFTPLDFPMPDHSDDELIEAAIRSMRYELDIFEGDNLLKDRYLTLQHKFAVREWHLYKKQVVTVPVKRSRFDSGESSEDQPKVSGPIN